MSRKVDISSYQIRIERSMIGISDDSSNEFMVNFAYYSHKGKKCELCGHEPIKRIFNITSKQTLDILEIGSECVQNQADVSLIEAFARTLDAAIKDATLTEIAKKENPEWERRFKAVENRGWGKKVRAMKRRINGKFLAVKPLTVTQKNFIEKLERMPESAKVVAPEIRQLTPVSPARRLSGSVELSVIERNELINQLLATGRARLGNFVQAMIDKLSRGQEITPNMLTVIKDIVNQHKAKAM